MEKEGVGEKKLSQLKIPTDTVSKLPRVYKMQNNLCSSMHFFLIIVKGKLCTPLLICLMKIREIS